MRATVQDGKVVRLEGEPDHPVNRGWICERSKSFVEHLYHPDRLNFPLKRVGERGEVNGRGFHGSRLSMK